MLNTGDTVKGRYSIVRTIGGGAYGTVYLVSDSAREGDSLAMKEMMEVEILESAISLYGCLRKIYR